MLRLLKIIQLVHRLITMANYLLTCSSKTRENQSLLLGVNEMKESKFRVSPRPIQDAKSYIDLSWVHVLLTMIPRYDYDTTIRRYGDVLSIDIAHYLQ